MAFRNKKTGKTISKDMMDQLKSFKKLSEAELPEKIEDELQNIVDDSFDKEQYQGKTGSSKWQRRKTDNEADRNKRRGLLIDSGGMRSETRVTRQGGTIKVTASKQVGKWNLAQIHNEGLSPQKKRQFMPEPGEKVDKLDKIIDDFMDAEMDKIFK